MLLLILRVMRGMQLQIQFGAHINERSVAKLKSQCFTTSHQFSHNRHPTGHASQLMEITIDNIVFNSLSFQFDMSARYDARYICSEGIDMMAFKWLRILVKTRLTMYKDYALNI